MVLAQEFRLAARLLARNRTSTAIALLALALGLGANVAIFSVVRLMVWVPLPYPGPDQLIVVHQTNQARGFRYADVSLQDARDWAASSGISSLAVHQARPMALSGVVEAQHLPAMQVSPEFFPTLGIAPQLGRTFTAAENPETESRVAVISHALWQGMFRGERAALGREIRLDGRAYTVVGIMPETFHFAYQLADVWVPISLDQAQHQRQARSLSTIGRMKPGVTARQVSAEMRAISERVEKEDPAGRDWRGNARTLKDRLSPPGAQAAAKSMFGAVGFVLLIACANVASLLLARGSQRRRELAIRASLGAGRASLIRLQLAESLLLSLTGGALGLVSAIWTVPLLKRIAPADMRVFELARLDWTAMAFAAGLSILTGIVFGLIPAWLLTRGALTPTLQQASRGSTGARSLILNGLVVAEIALALVLVAGSSLMMRSLLRHSSIDPGFDKTNLTTARVLLSKDRYPEDPQVVNFYSAVLANLRRDAGVESAALVDTIPLGGNNTWTPVRAEGAAENRRDELTGELVISPGYFQTLRIPLLAGRDVTEADHAGAPPVALVNQTFVKRFWPGGGSPVGRRVQIGTAARSWITVVGLAQDVRHRDPFSPPRAEVYLPHAQVPSRRMMLVARSRNQAQSPAGAMRAAVTQVDREQPLFRLQTLEATLYNNNSGARATAQVLALLGGIALILAAIGTYGVMAYMAAQRVREIGIRLALGATPPDVFRMMLKGGLVLAGLGLLIGLPASYGVAPLLAAVDEGVNKSDTAAYAGVALTLALTALAACILPAWRTMRVDPASVLRGE